MWFSNGAASAVAWMETVLRYGDICEVVAVNNPVQEEDADNHRFALDVAKWVGSDIVFWKNPKFPNASAEEVWDHCNAMAFPHGAPCTDRLKKAARQDYEKHRRIGWHVFGFTADERKRHERFVLTERDNVLPVLIDAGITKDDCYEIIRAAGILLPLVYRLGYPNANCLGCVKATSPTYWNHLRRMHPEIFKRRSEQSRRLGVRLVRYKGQRMFLDELPPDAVGRPMKTMRIECGIFCEEWPVSNDNSAEMSPLEFLIRSVLAA
ncbi:hypothetical protein AAFN47_25735 [Hoeflea sp. CAU 1731]